MKYLSFRKNDEVKYNPMELVSLNCILDGFSRGAEYHVFSDIDKTYLDTGFESLIGMAKIAFEKAPDKKTIIGADDFLKGLRLFQKEDAPPGVRLHFVSSSPVQLRRVLTEKFILDGLLWDSDTLKNQSYNIKSGNYKLLTKHVTYKTLAIINVLKKIEGQCSVLFIGDWAEYDPFIYLGLSSVLNRQITLDSYFQYLQRANIPDDICGVICADVESITKIECTKIFLRKIAHKEKLMIPAFENQMVNFDNYLQLSYLTCVMGIMPIDNFISIMMKFHNAYGWSMAHIIQLFPKIENEIAIKLNNALDDIYTNHLQDRGEYEDNKDSACFFLEKNSSLDAPWSNFNDYTKHWYEEIKANR